MRGASSAERVLAWWLRFSGLVCALALVAMVMPRSWHAATHEWLGLGTFPDEPIAEYLARGMSGVCGFYGVLLVYVSRDVRRYAGLIAFQAAALMGLSLAATVVLWPLAMPRWWLVADFISVWVSGAVILLLVRAARNAAD
jgi:hypothetical protein